MSPVPMASDQPRPFLPTRDFERSVQFYETLGFTKLHQGGDVAIFRVGAGELILQRHYVEEWAANFMMQLLVDSLDDWWRHIESLDLAARFGVRAPQPPALQPWGLRVAYVVDPSGVLWHFAERPAHERTK